MKRLLKQKLSKKKSSLAPIALILISLTACGTTNCSDILPAYPKAGVKVAEEIQTVCFNQDPKTKKLKNVNCPELFDWLQEIKKLEKKLDKSQYQESFIDKIKGIF